MPRPEGNNAEDAVYPGRRRSLSLAQCLQLPPHPLCMPHSAHLGVEAVGWLRSPCSTGPLRSPRARQVAQLDSAILLAWGAFRGGPACSVCLDARQLARPRPPRAGGLRHITGTLGKWTQAHYRNRSRPPDDGFFAAGRRSTPSRMTSYQPALTAAPPGFHHLTSPRCGPMFLRRSADQPTSSTSFTAAPPGFHHLDQGAFEVDQPVRVCLDAPE